MNRYVVDEQLFSQNVSTIQKMTSLELIGVIKGNGYGFGLEYMAKLLCSHHIKTLAVTELGDVQTLRNIHIPADILLMRATSLPEEAAQIAELQCVATIGSLEEAQLLNETAAARGIRIRAHIKINTGLCRFGFSLSSLEEIAQQLVKMNWLDYEGIYTHFSNSFADPDLTLRQYSLFRQAVDTLEHCGFYFRKVHCANTSAFLSLGQAIEEGMTSVRIGSAWCGRVINPDQYHLNKIGYVQSEVLETRSVPAGTKIGYCGSYTARRPMEIAVIPLGYYDGFGVQCHSDIPSFKELLYTLYTSVKQYLKPAPILVQIHGKSFPVIGSIGYTSIIVDVTDGQVQPRDTVIADPSPLHLNPLLPREIIHSV